MTITSEIIRHLQADGDRPACYIFDNEGVSWPITSAALLKRAGQFAAELNGLGIRRSIVAITLYHGLDLYAAFLGTLLSQNIPTMVAPPSPRMEIDKYNRNLLGLIRHIAPQVLISDVTILDAIHRSTGTAPELKLLSPNGLHEENVLEPSSIGLANIDRSDIAVIQHSSGTTGQQKGISLTHAAILEHNAAYSRAIDLCPDDVIVSWLPLYHDMGFIAAFLLPLTSGIPFVQMSQFDWVAKPHLLLQAITQHRGTLCWMPNFAFNFMADRVRDSQLEGCSLDSLRGLINCSEPVSLESMQRFVERFRKCGFSQSQLGASYAMAENVFAVTQTTIGELQHVTIDLEVLQREQRVVERPTGKSFVSNGPVVSGTEVRIISPSGEHLPDRQLGEIALRGQTLFAGYFERPDLTATCMTKDGWYLTGDLGFTIDGHVYVSGRKKDIIIIQGRNFALADIEALLAEVAGLIPGRVVAFGVPDDRSGTERLIVVAETNLEDDESIGRAKLEIRTRIAQSLDCTAGDVQLFKDRWLVKSTAGKLSRAENRQKYVAFLEDKSR